MFGPLTRISGDSYKSLISGDTLSSAQKGKDPYVGPPVGHGLAIGFGLVPNTILESGGAVERRTRGLPFDGKTPAVEDKSIKEGMKRDLALLFYIFTAKYVEATRDGIDCMEPTRPRKFVAADNRLRSKTSPITEFLLSDTGGVQPIIHNPEDEEWASSEVPYSEFIKRYNKWNLMNKRKTSKPEEIFVDTIVSGATTDAVGNPIRVRVNRGRRGGNSVSTVTGIRLLEMNDGD